jgi:hypothetical protein
MVMSPRAERLRGKRYTSIVDRVTLCYFRFGLLSQGARSARTMIGFKQIEFFDHTGFSRGYRS